ncbi:hypothetical protein HDU76_011698, partial [Blyttiomyces sp. JEL0837]
CDPLTRSLNNLLSSTETRDHANLLWNLAFKFNSKDILARLPQLALPTILNGLCNVHTRSMYINLCKLRPMLGNIKLIHQHFTNETLWAWTLPSTPNIKHHFDIYVKSLSQIDDLFIHIPMRQCWMDELPDFMVKDKLKLFITAGCFGHCDLFRRLKSEFFVPKDILPWISSFSTLCQFILQVAVERGFADVVSILVKVSGVNASIDDNDLMMTAISEGHTDVFKILLDAVGAHPVTNGNRIFWHAISNGRIDIVRLLLDVPGVDPGADCNKAIQLASENGYLDIVQLLVNLDGVDATAMDNEAFILACQNGHLPVAKLLLSIPHVDPSASDNSSIFHACENGFLDVVQFLVGTGLVDVTNNDNESLRIAARNGHLEVV